MDWFNLIKRFYENGNWSKEQVKQALNLNKITELQYEEIIGGEE